MRGEILHWRSDQFPVIFEWFRGRQEYENSIRVETPNTEDPQLHAVKKAILNALGDGFSEIRVKVTEEDAELIVIKKELELAFYHCQKEKKCNRTGRRSEPEAGNCNPKRENPLEGDGMC